MSKLNGKYENEFGDIYFYKDKKLHREDGPAVEYSDGRKFWYLNNQLHREDGPAFEDIDGTKEWFLFDKEYTGREFNQWLAKKHLNEKLHSTLAPLPSIRRGKI